MSIHRKDCFLNYHSVYPYPICYDFRLNDELNISPVSEMWRVTEIGLKLFALASEILSPSWLVPYAGDPRFRRSDIFHHNWIFENLHERLLLMIKRSLLIKLAHGDYIDIHGKVNKCDKKCRQRLEEIMVNTDLDPEVLGSMREQFFRDLERL